MTKKIKKFDALAHAVAVLGPPHQTGKALIHQLAGNRGRFVLDGDQAHPCDREARVQALARELLPVITHATWDIYNEADWKLAVTARTFELAEVFIDECDRRNKGGQP